jgi:hypothetical protein
VGKILEKIVFYRFITGLLLIVSLGGCQVGSRPRLRVSDYFGDPTGMRFPDPDNLGHHSLAPSHEEKLGMLYTCKGGFIDLGHVREAADRTEYASQLVYNTLLRSRTSGTFRIIEPARYHLTISYPDQWRNMSWQQRKKIARDVSVSYGQYLAHTSLIWHEILTWYGFASSGVFSENISAFSWEDTYSDVLGTRLAVMALNTANESYEDAMTRLINETLRQLDVQPAETARKAEHAVWGEWFEGGYYFFVNMRKRNFDVGLDDGFVTPWLIPGICPDTVPQDCPAPNPGTVLEKYGFKMRLQIEPLEFEKGKIYKAIGLNPSEYLRPSIHFREIIEQIRQESRKREGGDS